MNSWWLKMLTISIWSWNVLFWEDEDKGGEDAEEDAVLVTDDNFVVDDFLRSVFE